MCQAFIHYLIFKMWVLLIVVSGVLLCYLTIYRPLTYWKRRGVRTVRPIPIFGNLIGSALHFKPLRDEVIEMYNAHPENRCSGVFFFHTPNLLIRDPELIKAIMIKEFHHFADHSQQFFRDNLDPILSKNLFVLRGKKWRNMRATLSPAFTGSKMKGMFNLISDCGAQMAEYLEKEIKNQKNGVLEIEMRDLASRFGSDVIATSAFGIKCDSLENKENEFYQMGKNGSNFKSWRFIGVNIFPCLMKVFNQGLIPKNVSEYFSQLVLETIEIREKQHILRPDMINLLMEARKGALKYEEENTGNDTYDFAAVDESNIGKSNEKLVLSDEDIIAQAFIFFIAGFDSASGAMSFCSHELTVNPDIQQRLQEEIDDMLNESNGKLTYERLQKMKYLDMVISETLRKWSLAPNIDRACTKTFTFKENDGTEITVEKGTNIMIPIIGFHYDPNYYSDPYKFDPERFSNENKQNIKPFTYMPFGLGPRNCIGSRFALMEVKIGMIYLLSNFDLVVTKNTQIPLKLQPIATKMAAEKGFNIGLKLRTHRK